MKLNRNLFRTQHSTPRCVPKGKENICPFTGNVHGSFIHNIPKLETAQTSIHGRMDKQIVVYLFNRVLLSDKKGTNVGDTQ